MSDRERQVARHYNETIFDDEVERLVRDCPVELAITTRYLDRYVAPRATVAEVGVGGGVYSEHLARRGCRLQLVDIAERLLRHATERLDRAGLAGRVLGVHKTSATRLEAIASGSCEAVLLLGPLYHLTRLADRQQAVHEAARVLAAGRLVVAVGINRLAYLRDAYRGSPEAGAARRAFHTQFLRDGNLDPAHAPPIGFAHLSTVAEFQALFADAFDQVALVGVESFANGAQAVLLGLPPADRTAWLDLIEQTGATTEGLGVSDHFLYIGRRRC
jgi:SAM-dependent methyltransferase